MTLSFDGALDRRTVIHASDLVADLVASPEVSAGWAKGSTCSGMTVGGLTRHLISQPVAVVALLRAARSQGQDAETLTLMGHYGRAPWLREDLDGETNQTIRESSDRQGAEGHETAVAVLTEARAALEAVLGGPAETTYIPWQGWRLATDDFLVTRLMEIVVHSDDLAASVGLRTPEFGLGVLDPVLRLLSALAVRRHGQDAIVRTLARPQRAPGTISAF